MRRLAFGVITLLLFPGSPLHAQNAAIDDLKGKIFDAHMAQQIFASGLKYCSELNGKSFYYQLRNRMLNLEEYAHSLENLVKAQVFNPGKRRPWTLQDAKERWEEVKKQAQEDKQKCELVQQPAGTRETAGGTAKARRSVRQEAMSERGSDRGRPLGFAAAPCRLRRSEGMSDGVRERLEGAVLRAAEAGGLRLRSRARALACVVALRATVPADAFTAETLGTERAGNGVIIRGNGLDPDDRLSDHRGGHDLADAERRPLGARPRARLRPGDRIRSGAGARQARYAVACRSVSPRQVRSVNAL